MFEKVSIFANNFFGSLRDKPGSHSLKKWIAIAVAAVYLLTSLRFTTSENLVAVLGVHAGLITALIITHSYYKNKSNSNAPPPSSDTQQG